MSVTVNKKGTRIMTTKAASTEPAKLFEKILDRSDIGFYDGFQPSIRHVSIAGPALLRAVRYVPGSAPPPDWKRTRAGFRKQFGAVELWVVPLARYWAIGRSVPNQPDRSELLVCAFSDNPIWTRKKEEAMTLADHCQPRPRRIAARWALLPPP
jgi:hypothetical protein